MPTEKKYHMSDYITLGGILSIIIVFGGWLLLLLNRASEDFTAISIDIKQKRVIQHNQIELSLQHSGNNTTSAH